MKISKLQAILSLFMIFSLIAGAQTAKREQENVAQTDVNSNPGKNQAADIGDLKLIPLVDNIGLSKELNKSGMPKYAFVEISCGLYYRGKPVPGVQFNLETNDSNIVVVDELGNPVGGGGIVVSPPVFSSTEAGGTSQSEFLGITGEEGTFKTRLRTIIHYTAKASVAGLFMTPLNATLSTALSGMGCNNPEELIERNANDTIDFLDGILRGTGPKRRITVKKVPFTDKDGNGTFKMAMSNGQSVLFLTINHFLDTLLDSPIGIALTKELGSGEEGKKKAKAILLGLTFGIPNGAGMFLTDEWNDLKFMFYDGWIMLAKYLMKDDNAFESVKVLWLVVRAGQADPVAHVELARRGLPVLYEFAPKVISGVKEFWKKLDGFEDKLIDFIAGWMETKQFPAATLLDRLYPDPGFSKSNLGVLITQHMDFTNDEQGYCGLAYISGTIYGYVTAMVTEEVTIALLTAGGANAAKWMAKSISIPNKIDKFWELLNSTIRLVKKTNAPQDVTARAVAAEIGLVGKLVDSKADNLITKLDDQAGGVKKFFKQQIAIEPVPTKAADILATKLDNALKATDKDVTGDAITTMGRLADDENNGRKILFKADEVENATKAAGGLEFLDHSKKKYGLDFDRDIYGLDPNYPNRGIPQNLVSETMAKAGRLTDEGKEGFVKFLGKSTKITNGIPDADDLKKVHEVGKKILDLGDDKAEAVFKHIKRVADDKADDVIGGIRNVAGDHDLAETVGDIVKGFDGVVFDDDIINSSFKLLKDVNNKVDLTDKAAKFAPRAGQKLKTGGKPFDQVQYCFDHMIKVRDYDVAESFELFDDMVDLNGFDGWFKGFKKDGGGLVPSPRLKGHYGEAKYVRDHLGTDKVQELGLTTDAAKDAMDIKSKAGDLIEVKNRRLSSVLSGNTLADSVKKQIASHAKEYPGKEIKYVFPKSYGSSDAVIMQKITKAFKDIPGNTNTVVFEFLNWGDVPY